MGYIEAVANAVFVYATPILVLHMLSRKAPQLMVLAFVGAAFFLCAFTVASIVARVIDNVFVSAVACSMLVAGARYLNFLLLKRTDRGFREMGSELVAIKHRNLAISISCGLGFGFCSAVVVYSPALYTNFDVGTYYAPSCQSMTFFQFSAVQCFLGYIVHCALHMTMFAIDQPRVPLPRRYSPWIVSVLQVTWTCLSFMNHSVSGACNVVIPLQLVFSAALVLFSSAVVYPQLLPRILPWRR